MHLIGATKLYLLQRDSARLSLSQILPDWTDLEYHLAHKIRIVHSQTHATQAAKPGRALNPELAFSVAQDLFQLLRLWGHCRP